VEGHVVLWLQGRQEGGEPLPFEEVKMSVQRDIARMFKQVHFAEWLQTRRRDLSLTVNKELLGGVKIP
jgi:hypothetical protein